MSVIHMWKGALANLNISTLRIKLLFVMRAFRTIFLLFIVCVVRAMPMSISVEESLLSTKYFLLASFLCAFLFLVLMISRVIMVSSSIEIYSIIQFLKVVSIILAIISLINMVRSMGSSLCVILYRSIPSYNYSELSKVCSCGGEEEVSVSIYVSNYGCNYYNAYIFYSCCLRLG